VGGSACLRGRGGSRHRRDDHSQTTTDEITANGQCSLREAIAAVNTPGSLGDCTAADDISNTIVLGPHEYDLTIHPDANDLQQTGDLDVTGTVPLTIEGGGVGSTTISGTNVQDRIIHVLAGATVTVEDMSLTGARAPSGANGLAELDGQNGMPPTAGGVGFPGGAIRNEGSRTRR
jgi:CSLREA domain-containing protein